MDASADDDAAMLLLDGNVAMLRVVTGSCWVVRPTAFPATKSVCGGRFFPEKHNSVCGILTLLIDAVQVLSLHMFRANVCPWCAEGEKERGGGATLSLSSVCVDSPTNQNAELFY